MQMLRWRGAQSPSLDHPSTTASTVIAPTGHAVHAGVSSPSIKRVAEQAGVASQHAACSSTAQETGGEGKAGVRIQSSTAQETGGEGKAGVRIQSSTSQETGGEGKAGVRIQAWEMIVTWGSRHH
jgi:hypothetical protein